MTRARLGSATDQYISPSRVRGSTKVLKYSHRIAAAASYMNAAP